MGILGMILTGLVVGLLARALKPGDDRMGFVGTVLLGIAGAIVAGYLGQAFHFYGPDEPAGLLGALVGAIFLLVVGQALLGRRRSW